MIFLGLNVGQIAHLLAWGELNRLTPRYVDDVKKLLQLQYRWQCHHGNQRIPDGSVVCVASVGQRKYATAIIIAAAARFHLARSA